MFRQGVDKIGIFWPRGRQKKPMEGAFWQVIHICICNIYNIFFLIKVTRNQQTKDWFFLFSKMNKIEKRQNCEACYIHISAIFLRLHEIGIIVKQEQQSNVLKRTILKSAHKFTKIGKKYDAIQKIYFFRNINNKNRGLQIHVTSCVFI